MKADKPTARDLAAILATVEPLPRFSVQHDGRIVAYASRKASNLPALARVLSPAGIALKPEAEPAATLALADRLPPFLSMSDFAELEVE